MENPPRKLFGDKNKGRDKRTSRRSKKKKPLRRETVEPKQPTQPKPEAEAYQVPAVIYEGMITTRAGSRGEENPKPGVDPMDLFD